MIGNVAMGFVVLVSGQLLWKRRCSGLLVLWNGTGSRPGELLLWGLSLWMDVTQQSKSNTYRSCSVCNNEIEVKWSEENKRGSRVPSLSI
jgi:hypothetical protein